MMCINVNVMPALYLWYHAVKVEDFAVLAWAVSHSPGTVHYSGQHVAQWSVGHLIGCRQQDVQRLGR